MMADANENPSKHIWSLQCEAAVILACLSTSSNTTEAAATLTFLSKSSSTTDTVNDLRGSERKALVLDRIDPVRKRKIPVCQEIQFTEALPNKLHSILESERYNEVIRWHSNEKSFVISDWGRLVSEVLPRHDVFKPSLQHLKRELCLWGFREVSVGQDEDVYTHELFKRGDPKSCIQIEYTKSREEISGVNISHADACKKFQAQLVLLDGTVDHRSSLLKGNPSLSRKIYCSNNDTIKEDDHEIADDENDGKTKIKDFFFRKDVEHTSLEDSVENKNARGNQLPPSFGVTSTSSTTAYPTSGNSVNRGDLNGLLRESPIVRICNLASQSIIDLDKDALTEMLLYHHHEKLSLRTAMLSNMLHALEERKREQKLHACQASADQQANAYAASTEVCRNKPLELGTGTIDSDE